MTEYNDWYDVAETIPLGSPEDAEHEELGRVGEHTSCVRVVWQQKNGATVREHERVVCLDCGGRGNGDTESESEEYMGEMPCLT